ncbi:MAG: site-2 protease family protein [Thermoplasmata archaeon YP2-bin.285]|uniref:Site-2 protease family protein n=1 Tax=Candidatus Sysuiplasma superficiale TaxID=2823368 RepID=A0A8J7YR91_9ARCH|nr:site-2 protease family protein [Candidatus Sysuiplasma superficiale]
MVRTEKGKGALDAAAKPKRFWMAYAAFARIAFVIGMVLMVALLLWEATLVFNIPKQNVPAPQTYLLLPGINPFVPIGYGILGLAVAVVLHELAHGILARAQGISVKSMGVLLLIVPIGAFVEPDQQEIEAADPLKRIKVFGVGPATNMVLALIFVLILVFPLMGSVQPVHTGLVIDNIYSDSSSYSTGMRLWGEIVSINNSPVTEMAQFNGIRGLVPGHAYNVEYIQNGKYHNGTVTAGVVITGIIPGSPAARAGIKPGYIVYEMNGTVIYNVDELINTFDNTTPNETVPFIFLTHNGTSTGPLMIRLSSEAAVEGTAPSGKQIGFLGIYFAFMGVDVTPSSLLAGILKDPFYGASSPTSYFQSGLQFLLLPFEGLSPVPQGIELLFSGNVVSAPIFWIAVNSCYWIFWINLWVGLFNMLPAIPLDGGYLFRDNLRLLLKKMMSGRTDENREKVAMSITSLFSVLIFMLILWQIIGPRLL